MGLGPGTLADLVTDPALAPSPGTRTLPVAGPSITEHEVELVSRAVRESWYEHANDITEQFEQSFAAHTRRRHAVALPSCTSALHLCLAGLGVGPGDEVIVPDATWIASSAPISYVGASPRFADVDPRHVVPRSRHPSSN